ncbi:MAG: ATP-binding protein [Nostocales cyanobacterium]|nr:MAG: ATP-binding protein [Nostocales cyanobacterium]
MKINQLSYYDSNQKWQFENINFSDFNLLVGVSGVGKSKIINAIINLHKIAEGNSLNGVKWDLKFTLDCSNYRWLGEFENSQTIDILSPGKIGFKIISEYLYKEDVAIIERNKDEIKFNGNLIPKISPLQSVISILYTEEAISPFYKGMLQISKHDSAGIMQIFKYDLEGDFLASKNLYNSIITGIIKLTNQQVNDKRNEEDFNILLNLIGTNIIPIGYKIIFVYDKYPKLFQTIKESFIKIFEQVEDIRIEESNYNLINPAAYNLVDSAILEKDNNLNLEQETFIISIKEKGVDEWIKQSEISSGMLKTFMLISEMYLSAEGTVILIDEFENSLGVNCIDIISDLLLENRNLQFIITSHHPYIINNIGMEHWKIITRKGGVVTARDAKDLNLGKSRHQAFMQLMNLEEYREGITA